MDLSLEPPDCAFPGCLLQHAGVDIDSFYAGALGCASERHFAGPAAHIQDDSARRGDPAGNLMVDCGDPAAGQNLQPPIFIKT